MSSLESTIVDFYLRGVNLESGMGFRVEACASAQPYANFEFSFGRKSNDFKRLSRQAIAANGSIRAS